MNARRDSLSNTQKSSAGRSYRSEAPRRALAQVAPRPTGYDPVARLVEHDASRVQGLLGLRYRRMLEGPGSFLRGAAVLMAEDLARGTSTGLTVQLCGDAHLSNFGVFLSPERELVFDINDFDETCEGPFEWDVKRLATSLVIASHQLGHDERQQREIAAVVAREYRDAVTRFATQTRLEVWYATLDVDRVVTDLRGFFSDAAARRIDDVMHHVKGVAASSSPSTILNYGPLGPRIALDAPRFSAVESVAGSMSADDVVDIVSGYARTLSSDRQQLLSQFDIREVVRHVVGVGSVGTECFAVLLTGRDDQDTFFLQIKEAQASVVAEARRLRTTLENGDRVVRGQRLMQAVSDPFLGWDTVSQGEHRRSFYVRQLFNDRASVDVRRLDEASLIAYGRLCAWTLARAHARFGRAEEIAGYLGVGKHFDESVAEFSLVYRDRNQRDFEALRDAVEQGRVTVAS
ncbi:MAG: DUF2252 domain-containing protein [Acidimicrobiales bacterium]